MRKLLRPVRRLAAWFALVHEERETRRGATEVLERTTLTLADAIDGLRNDLDLRVDIERLEIEALRQEMTRLREDLENGVGLRADITLKELWRRLEGADARQATEIQRIGDQMRRILEENAVLFHASDGRSDDADVPAAERHRYSVPTRKTMFRERVHGVRDEAIAKFGAYMEVFGAHGPVVDLGCGRGEFLELAASKAIVAYGVDEDPESIDFCRGLGLDVRLEAPLTHLRSLEGATLGGVFCSHVVERIPFDAIPDLFGQIERVLHAGGVAAIESLNPESFAAHVHGFWHDPGVVRPVSPSSLAFAARLAGLVVEDTIYLSPLPEEASLKIVDAPTDSPDVRKMLDGFNAALSQLNDLLYGPLEYALVVRKS